MFTYATRQQSPLKIIQGGFQLFKNSFSRIWLLMLIYVLLEAILFPVAISPISVAAIPMFALLPWVATAGNVYYILALVVTLSLTVVAFLTFLQLVIVGRIHHDERLAPVAYVALRKLWPYLLLLILFELIPGLAFKSLVFKIFLFEPTGSVLQKIGVLLIGGIWLYLLIPAQLFASVFMVDALSFVQTVKQSFKFIYGHWWRTLLVLIPGYIVVGLFLAAPAWWGRSFGYWGYLLAKIIVMAFLMLSHTFLASVRLVQLNDLKLRYGAKQSLQQLNV